MLKNILQRTISAEFDYNLLISCLSDYKNPRKKITKLLKNKDIIRVKKGLYVFGPEITERSYSLEVLANLIYGPSYISCEYALSFYGLIPERIEIVTSITNKRNKFFKTPVGEFSYKYLPKTKYSCGITQLKIDDNRNILIAIKEKAIIDLIWKAKDLSGISQIQAFFLDNLRMDEYELKKLDINQILEINKIFKSSSVNALAQYLGKIKS